uniref:Phospholipid-transporting ATPase n=1 Tax=Gadus morhua TaxID=8049 RepID=A0A8C5B6P9_GADMO
MVLTWLLPGPQTNGIKTSKYNFFTFLPLNLFEQFQRIANVYFLFLLLLQVPPQNTRTTTSSGVSLSSVWESITDTAVRRVTDTWLPFKLGHFGKVTGCLLSFQADLLLLSSSEPLNLVYIETAELDGSVCVYSGCVCCEPPNNRLDHFTGTLLFGDHKFSLDNGKVLLRGCTLRNTHWCYGLVLFGGPDTKLMQNCGKNSFKRTSIDRLMNVLVLCIFGVLALMCAILAVGNYLWEINKGYQFNIFLPREDDSGGASLSAFLTFWSYVIILNTVVPISLYVSVEIIRLGNSFYIDWDRKMYDARSDTPAEARTTTLNEELGQIKYIFSDKTGTLTQNIMTFNKCTINGKTYGERELDEFKLNSWDVVDFSFNPLADPKFSFYDHSLVEAVKLGIPEVQGFFRLLALCHTVMAEEKSKDQLAYQAQSPDEGALVTAARNFGFVFRSRTPESITIMEMGKQQRYELLAILDFDNVRKRMSVIVRSPEGKVSLYCKGADSVIFERLNPSCRKLMEVTTEHLNEFAGDGLRTLALAYKDVDEDFFSRWKQQHHKASTALENREAQLDQLFEEIETDLLLLGATAIEDKLQDGVPQTIEQLAKADIKIWVLTGDKQETAENIGYSCNLLREEMNDVFIVSGNTPEEVKQQLSPVYDPVHPIIPQAYALEEAMELEFLWTACMCQAVICCRVTPLQKAQVVELVKKYKKAVTLAIGDGANDVSMIKAAHIGVGISGQEGMQAVSSSDYSFAQFRFLQRLLLVHGRWSYLRMCKFLRYFFYKNFTFTFVHFWFAFFCGFSAQTVYDEWFITLYNLVYTALPVLGLSLFDQDVNDAWSFQHPQLYVPGQLNLYFSKMAFFKCALHSGFSSLVLFFIPYAAMSDSMRQDGKDLGDYQSFAVVTQTCLLFTVCIQLSLEMSYWTAVNTLFIVGSLLLYFGVTFTMYSNGLFRLFPSAFSFIGTARNTLNQSNVWLTILLTSILCVLPVLTYRFLTILLWPTINDKVMFKARQAKAAPPPPSKRTRIRRGSSRRSGYAFSHAQGYGELVTSRRFLRRPAVSHSSHFTPMKSTSSFIPMGRSAGYSPTDGPHNAKAQGVEGTSLQMYRIIQDQTL